MLHVLFTLPPVFSSGYYHVVVEVLIMPTETIGLLGMGAQDGHLDSHTVPEL